MPTQRLGIIMHGITGRMGYNQHLVRSICAIRDQGGYLASVASCVRRAAPAGDVVVLAQASMAGAAELCEDVRVPILSSPRPGLEAAVRAYRAAS